MHYLSKKQRDEYLKVLEKVDERRSLLKNWVKGNQQKPPEIPDI